MIRQTFISLLATATLTTAIQASDVCIRPKEEQADKIQFVQTHFMVAALQCRSQGGGALTGLYNDFVKSHKSKLVETKQPLKNYLERRGDLSLDGYKSDIANLVSLASIRIADFCDRTRQVAELSVNASTPVNLVELMPVRYQRPSARCGVAVADSTKQ